MTLSIQSGLALADAYRSGETTPSDVLETALTDSAQIPHAFISITADRARAEADRATQRWKNGQPLSALDGVPLAWKDLFDVAGTVTTAGAAVRRHSPVAVTDASLVRRASQAGLVCLGKTNLSELAYSGLGLNPHFGTPCLPGNHHPARAPGGSSSGSAVAVAAGITPLSIGTDTAGSVRIPAAFNGIVGYRPSPGRYPADGIFPLSATLDCPGLLAKHVSDVVALDTLLVAPPSSLPHAELAKLTFVVDDTVLLDARVTSSVRNNLECLLTKLSDAGAHIVRRRRTIFTDVLEHIVEDGWLGSLEAFLFHRPLLDSPDVEQLDPRVRARLEQSRPVQQERVDTLRKARLRLQHELIEDLGDTILVTPTVSHVAPPLEPLETDTDHFFEVNSATLRLTMSGSLLGMAGVTFPSGIDKEGFSTGTLFAMRRGQDVQLLSAMLAVEDALAPI